MPISSNLDPRGWEVDLVVTCCSAQITTEENILVLLGYAKVKIREHNTTTYQEK